MIKHNFCAKVSAKIILKIHQVIQVMMSFYYKKYKIFKKLNNILISLISFELVSFGLGTVEYVIFSLPTPSPKPAMFNLSMTKTMLLAHATVYSMVLIAWIIIKIKKPTMRFFKAILKRYKVNVQDEIMQEKLKSNK